MDQALLDRLESQTAELARTGLFKRERVIASTDCGLGGRVHRDIAWAKLETLAQGAAIASRQLWG